MAVGTRGSAAQKGGQQHSFRWLPTRFSCIYILAAEFFVASSSDDLVGRILVLLLRYLLLHVFRILKEWPLPVKLIL